jgi:putative FmdB family regulatory protein
MPTYQYRCADCGHSFDQFQRFAEDPLTDCPECEGSIKRVPQPVGVVFKGSGWYITDSRESKSGKNKAADTSSSGESGNGSAKKESDAKPSSESKPAAVSTESKSD